MSVTYGFYNSENGDRKYNSVQMSELFDGLIADGIFATQGGAFVVSANVDMTVLVADGRAWFNHTWTKNDAGLPVVVPLSDLVFDRIDTLVIEVDSETRMNAVKVISGVPSATPEAPVLINTASLNQYPLADIYVAANVTEITAPDITNRVGTSETPFVTGIIDTIDIDDLLEQWQGEFDEWFDGIKDILDESTAGNLLNLYGQSNKPYGYILVADDIQLDRNLYDIDAYMNLKIEVSDIIAAGAGLTINGMPIYLQDGVTPVTELLLEVKFYRFYHDGVAFHLALSSGGNPPVGSERQLVLFSNDYPIKKGEPFIYRQPIGTVSTYGSDKILPGSPIFTKAVNNQSQLYPQVVNQITAAEAKVLKTADGNDYECGIFAQHNGSNIRVSLVYDKSEKAGIDIPATSPEALRIEWINDTMLVASWIYDAGSVIYAIAINVGSTGNTFTLTKKSVKVVATGVSASAYKPFSTRMREGLIAGVYTNQSAHSLCVFYIEVSGDDLITSNEALGFTVSTSRLDSYVRSYAKWDDGRVVFPIRFSNDTNGIVLLRIDMDNKTATKLDDFVFPGTTAYGPRGSARLDDNHFIYYQKGTNSQGADGHTMNVDNDTLTEVVAYTYDISTSNFNGGDIIRISDGVIMIAQYKQLVTLDVQYHSANRASKVVTLSYPGTEAFNASTEAPPNYGGQYVCMSWSPDVRNVFVAYRFANAPYYSYVCHGKQVAPDGYALEDIDNAATPGKVFAY